MVTLICGASGFVGRVMVPLADPAGRRKRGRLGHAQKIKMVITVQNNSFVANRRLCHCQSVLEANPHPNADSMPRAERGTKRESVRSEISTLETSAESKTRVRQRFVPNA